jgi:hypothetical protein
MKNYILLALFAACIGATANAQTVTVQNVTITYNEAAAKNVGFSLDVTNNANGGSGSGLCKNAYVAIGHVQKLCGCVLTPNQVLNIFTIAKEEAPQWALDNAGVKRL